MAARRRHGRIDRRHARGDADAASAPTPSRRGSRTEGRPQRSVSVRQREEVEKVPWRVNEAERAGR